jgi:hypothetical protein
LALYNLGGAFADRGRREESVRDLLEATRLDPKRTAEIVSKMDNVTGRTPGTVSRDGLPGRGGVG